MAAARHEPAGTDSPAAVDTGGGDGEEFGYHLYDLSNGQGGKFAGFIGPAVPAVFHSAVVAFGWEWFFEGGVMRRVPGATRFGDAFRYLPHPTRTRKSVDEFRVWCHAAEHARFQLLDYRTIDNNCNDFCNEATKFLTDGEEGPDELRRNVADLVASPAGAFGAHLLRRLTGAHIWDMAKLVRFHELASQDAAFAEINITAAIGVLPPRMAASVFGAGAPAAVIRRRLAVLKAHLFTVIATYRGIMPRADADRLLPADGGPIEEAAAALGRAFASRATEHNAGGAVSPNSARLLVAAVHGAMRAAENFAALRAAWRAFATLLLDPECALQLLSHRGVYWYIVYTTESYFELPIPSKLLFLELLCNLSATEVGAAVYFSLQSDLADVIAATLFLPDWHLLERCAALAVNFVLAQKFVHRASLGKDAVRRGARHPVLRVLVASLAFLNHVATTEPSKLGAARDAQVQNVLHHILQFLFWTVTESASIARYFQTMAGLVTSWDALIGTACQTRETRALALALANVAVTGGPDAGAAAEDGLPSSDEEHDEHQ